MSDDITVVEFETFVQYYTNYGPIDEVIRRKFLALPSKVQDEIFSHPQTRYVDSNG